MVSSFLFMREPASKHFIFRVFIKHSYKNLWWKRSHPFGGCSRRPQAAIDRSGVRENKNIISLWSYYFLFWEPFIKPFSYWSFWEPFIKPFSYWSFLITPYKNPPISCLFIKVLYFPFSLSSLLYISELVSLLSKYYSYHAFFFVYLRTFYVIPSFLSFFYRFSLFSIRPRIEIKLRKSI